ncbi:hypothetical protein EJ110_NYTH21426 [Nymphaea thermarum]|nr:hypothetical protein EJ110_NYTH21426 [Nymphaea thermarum]
MSASYSMHGGRSTNLWDIKRSLSSRNIVSSPFLLIETEAHGPLGLFHIPQQGHQPGSSFSSLHTAEGVLALHRKRRLCVSSVKTLAPVVSLSNHGTIKEVQGSKAAALGIVGFRDSSPTLEEEDLARHLRNSRGGGAGLR